MLTRSDAVDRFIFICMTSSSIMPLPDIYVHTFMIHTWDVYVQLTIFALTFIRFKPLAWYILVLTLTAYIGIYLIKKREKTASHYEKIILILQ